jgi:hypothetical protein
MDSDNSGLGAVARDAAIRILKSARPEVAKIKDKAERKRVCDALIAAVHGQIGAGSQMATVMKATSAVVQQKARDSMVAAIDEEAVQKAYDSQNPHRKGKV